MIIQVKMYFGVKKTLLAPKKWGKTSFHEELVNLKKKVKKNQFCSKKNQLNC